MSVNNMSVSPTPKTKTIYNTDRPGYSRITIETEESLACYYEGESLKTILNKFSAREDDYKYMWRLEATINNYDNYVKEILEKYIEGIDRSGAVERKTTITPLDEYLAGRFKKFVTDDLQPMSLLLPEIFVQICTPKHDAEKVVSLQDKIDQKLFPYPVLVFPQYVQSFCQDLSGELEWITIKSGATLEYWDKTETGIIDENGEIKERKPHGFPSIPFVRVYWRENKAVMGNPKPGHSMMFSIVKKTIGAMSFISMLNESALFHLFPKLVWDEDTKKLMQKQGGMGPDTPLTERRGPEGQVSTRYLATPTGEFEILDKIVYERIPQVIYRAARLRDHSTDKEQSGISKAFDMVPEVSVLSKIADYFETTENRLITKIRSYWDSNLKDEPNMNYAKYPKTFDVKNTAEVLQETGDLMETVDGTSIPQSPTANKIIAKDLYRRTLPNATPEQIAVIEKEIDAATAEDGGKPKPPIPNPNQVPPPIPPIEGEEQE